MNAGYGSEPPTPSTPREPRSSLSLRVSRDSGRTWGTKVTYRAGTFDLPDDALWDMGTRYPPCRCPRCRPEPTRRSAELRWAVLANVSVLTALILTLGWALRAS